MVLLPEEAEMTLAELRQMAARQQHQIEAQQQLLVAKEQRLKFLKQQEARHHQLADLKIDPVCLQELRESVQSQEHKLRQLRALRGQMEQQKTNNSNLCTELESIRTLFTEKEKELNIAVSKVEELTRQLDEIRNNNSTRKPVIPPAVTELENLRQDLMYRTKITEQQNHHISQQRELISERQKDICQIDQKIAELTHRLQRKRLLNQQLANQIHNASMARHSSLLHTNMYSNPNIAAVEPIQRDLQDSEHTRDDLAAKLSTARQEDLGEFSPKKNDPKYQTLPYNTKFCLKEKTNYEELSPNSDDVFHSDTSSEHSSSSAAKPTTSMCNFAPRPFTSNIQRLTSQIPVARPILQQVHQLKPQDIQDPSVHVSIAERNDSIDFDGPKLKSCDAIVVKSKLLPNTGCASSINPNSDCKVSKEKCSGVIVKPVVPPKPMFPVKPTPPPRQTPTMPSKERSIDDRADAVSNALSVLQKKSSSRENIALRYSGKNSCNEGNSTPTSSKIATYFPRSSVLNDSKPSGNNEESRRKPNPIQLPIKPKPLTIKKTPGLEPPKLKTQQNSNGGFHRKVNEVKVSEINFLSTFKPTNSLPVPVPQQKERLITKKQLFEAASYDVPKLETYQGPIPRPKYQLQEETSIDLKTKTYIDRENEKLKTFEKQKAKDKEEENVVKPQDQNEDDDETSSSPCDSLECLPVYEGTSDDLKVDSDYPVHHSAAFRRAKGSLKTEGNVRGPRRVSFDPLALLLDAALEGELELVKKTAQEVPNPSAANDEGTTALHNAICAGHTEVVAFLVEFGCDVNAQDCDGWTPLHCAASCNNLPIVKFLVEKGACIFATTLSDEETAAEKCEEDGEGFDGCSEYLYGLQENMGIINDGIVYAVYDYGSHNADELSFRDGDKIKVLRNGDEQESEWWWSRVNDEEGYVPRNLLGLYPRVSPKKG